MMHHARLYIILVRVSTFLLKRYSASYSSPSLLPTPSSLFLSPLVASPLIPLFVILINFIFVAFRRSWIVHDISRDRVDYQVVKASFLRPTFHVRRRRLSDDDIWSLVDLQTSNWRNYRGVLASDHRLISVRRRRLSDEDIWSLVDLQASNWRNYRGVLAPDHRRVGDDQSTDVRIHFLRLTYRHTAPIDGDERMM